MPDYMIPMDCSQNTQYVINFTSDEMISKFEAFTNNKKDTFHLIKSTRTEWLQMLG